MATNKNFIVKNGLDVSGTANLSTLNLTGSLTGPASFTIDPAAVGDNTGTVIIAGNLQVDGTQTTINSTTMTVDDLNLTLASGAANAAAANGAGITVDGSSATFTYANSDDSWAVNKRFKAQSDIRLGSDGVRLSTDGNGEFGVGYGQTATNYRFTVYNNTAAALRVLPNGNVGIGNTNPPEMLTIGSTSDTHVRIQFLSSTTGGNTIHFGDGASADAYRGWINYTHSDDALAFATAGSEAMRINNSGGVVINKSNFSSLPTGSLLNIFGDGVTLRLDGSSQTTKSILFRQTSSANPGEVYADGSLRLRTEDPNTRITFHTNSSGSNNERMRITSGGNVGIGTSDTYGRKFVVEGTGDLMMLRSTNAGAGGAQLDLVHDSASAADGDSVGIINFSNTVRQFASVTGKSANGSQGALHLGVRTDASNYNHNALVIDNSGNTDISGRLHIGTALSDTRITLGSTGTENTNSSSNVRSSSGNLMYNAGSSSHIWELAGTQKMNLGTNGLLTFVGGNNTEGISLGANHRIYGGANRLLEAPTSSTGQISLGEGYANGSVKVFSKFILGTFPQSTTNSGEAWIGRAADRQDGTMTVQLGGNDHTNTKFEIVDRAWTKVMYSFAGEAPGGTITTQSQGYMHVGSQQSQVFLYLGSQGGAFGGNSSNWLRANGTNFMLNAAGGNFLFEISGTQRGYINASGFNNGSDVALKENIEDIEYGLNTVNQLRPRKFDRIDSPDVDKAEVGFIAQEVEPIIPELISNSKPEGAEGQIIKGMNYGALTSVLVKAIQEQQVIIDDLKSRLEALEG